MENKIVEARLANSSDFDKLELIFKSHCNRMNLQWSNFQPIAKKVLSHSNLGLVLIAENAEKIAVGFMMFTYEWCDWRNGLFFWV